MEATHHKTRPKRSIRPSWPTEGGSMGHLQCSGSKDSAFRESEWAQISAPFCLKYKNSMTCLYSHKQQPPLLSWFHLRNLGFNPTSGRLLQLQDSSAQRRNHDAHATDEALGLCHVSCRLDM